MEQRTEKREKILFFRRCLEKSHERLPERRVGDSQARNDRVNTCAPLRLRRNDASARAALDDARELDIVVGIVGSYIGGFLFGPMLGSTGGIAPYLSAFLGAIVLLAIVNLIRRGSVR